MCVGVCGPARRRPGGGERGGEEDEGGEDVDYDGLEDCVRVNCFGATFSSSFSGGWGVVRRRRGSRIVVSRLVRVSFTGV